MEVFGNQASKSEKDSIKLPNLDTLNKLNYEEIRAVADSKSLRFNFQIEKL